MKKFAAEFDKLPWILRLICALPGLDGIIYGIYRICKGHLIAGLIWIFVGTFITWIIDLFCMITKGKVTFFAD